MVCVKYIIFCLSCPGTGRCSARPRKVAVTHAAGSELPQWLHAAPPALRDLQRGRETERPAAPLVFSHPHLYWTWRPVLVLECTLFFGMGGILSVGFQMSWADMQAVSPGSAALGRPCLSPEGLRGKGSWSRLRSEDDCGAPVNPLCLLKAIWVFCFIRSFYVFSRPSGFFSQVPLAVSVSH